MIWAKLFRKMTSQRGLVFQENDPPDAARRPWCLEDSGTSLAGPKSQKLLQNGLNQLKLGKESMYLHLPDLTDTISYALGPRDAKNDAKTTSRNTPSNQENFEFGHEMARDGSI